MLRKRNKERRQVFYHQVKKIVLFTRSAGKIVQKEEKYRSNFQGEIALCTGDQICRA